MPTESPNLILYLIFGFIITFFECYCSRRNQLFNQLSTQIVEINGDYLQPTFSDKDYVFYHTSNMKYSTVEDPLFGISHDCGFLDRKVQYCQWVEVQHSETIEKGNKTYTKYYYTYHKQWLHHQVTSLFFHDRIYHNPTVPTVDEVTIRGFDTKAGAYKIGQDMILKGSKNYLYPDVDDIVTFERSEISSDFKYSGKGVFYSSYQRNLFEKILRAAQFFDMKSDLVDWCTPGDRRVWFEVWEPKNATIVGARFDGMIDLFEFNGYKVGAVFSGDVGLKKALMTDTSSFPDIVMWILRILLVVFFGASVYNHTPDFFGLAAFVFCIVLGNIVPNKVKMNIWRNLSLSAICGLGVLLIKQQELNNQ